ncbi:hypothetical protein DL770_008122 [Monosporascus sp. CRB-9-2]|nr:hypothetical protein DL770_008122 [Monosporascus sp. CRB-9-2]
MLKTCIAAAALLSEPAMALVEPSPTLSLAPTGCNHGPRTTSSGIPACEALKDAGLRDRLLFPTDPGYEPQIESWWAENVRLRPYCLVLPRNSGEVSTALTTLVDANDGAGDWHIAVRSGGHSSTGSSNTAHGVTIDLSLMNSTSYDRQSNIAKIEPGGRWKNVFADLGKDGVTVAGGRDGGVGVGGFLLGGGISFFSGKRGFGCDSVVNFEVVLANGTIVNANQTANADLWRALKGGSNNFGIVTRFDLEAIPARDLYYDLRLLDSAYSDLVVDAVVEFADQDQSLADDALVTFYSHDTSVSSKIHVCTIHVNTMGNKNSATALQKIEDLPVIANFTVFQSMAEAAAGSQIAPGSRNAGSTLTFYNDPQIVRRCIELHMQLVETLKGFINPDKFRTLSLFQPIPSYMGTISQQRGGNMLGLDDMQHNALMWTAGVAVDSDLDQGAFAMAHAEMNKMTAQVKEFSRSVHGDMGFVYLNYADASQDPLGSYGLRSVEHMRNVAAKRSPCASCVTLNVACRTTRRAPEKRQRVLLSSKYEEAVQEIGHHLADVKGMLHTLISSKDVGSCPPSSTGRSSEFAHRTQSSMIDEQVPTLSSVHEGYNGDSSFQSHAHRVESALDGTLAASELIDVEAPMTLPLDEVKELLHSAGTTNAITSDHVDPGNLPPPHNLELGDMPLPPIDVVLKLLRLAKADKQRFFVDVPLFQEDEFADMCRGVYFATEPISIWTWICVNVGLYFLFLGVSEVNSRRMGTSVEAIRSHSRVLMANAETALQSLRLCSEPSAESCRALALLGHSIVAWRLMSGAARASLDLGLHRLANHVDGHDLFQKRSVFWYIYAWDKGLAMTCGRTPVIHHYDVTTGFPLNPEDRSSVPGRLYGAFLDYSIVSGEIQRKLFSASAQHASHEDRTQQADRENPTWDEMFGPAAIVIDIMLYSLLTIVYRTLPPSSIHAHPLQCSDECVDAARNALSTLVKVGERVLRKDRARWGMLLNVVLSLVPFASFIVLAGNAIATTSSVDLSLLSSVVSILAPIAADYPTVRKVHDACERFRRIASLIVSSTSGNWPNRKEYQGQASSNGLPPNDSADTFNSAHSNSLEYGFPMAQQDWDSTMVGFESELGNYDPRALTHIIEPYIANADWW